MGHVSGSVIGDDHDAQLAPFHEFECTGNNDQYVQDVNKTDEAWASYAAHTTKKVRDPDGNHVEIAFGAEEQAELGDYSGG